MKKVLAIILTAVLLLSVVPMSVFAAGPAIDSVEIPVVEIIENCNGSWEGYYADPENPDSWVENGWFRYDPSPRDIVINYTESGQSQYDELNHLWEAGHQYNIVTEQSYETRWEVGNNYQAQLYIDDIAYPFTVNIIENPVESVTIKPVEVIENSRGYWSGYWNEETEEWVENAYYCYDVQPTEITIEFKDDSPTFTGSFDEAVEAGYIVSYYSDQSYENQWGIGDHTAYFEINGTKYPYDVKVVESPVKNIKVPTQQFYEGINGYWDGHYTDPEDESSWVENSWFYYSVYPDEITVEMKNGDKFTGEIWEIEEQLGTIITVSDEQSYNKQWGVGNHTANISIYGKEYQFNVTIKASPLKSIYVSDMQLSENQDGFVTESWVAGECIHWYEYNTTPDKITVTLTDNTVIEGERWEVLSRVEEILGCYVELYIDSDQSYDNKWGLGEHTLTATLANNSCDYKVTIIESDIESVTVDNVSVIEGTNGYYDEMTESYVYNDADPNVTVKLKDGRTVYSQNGYVNIGDWSFKIAVYCDVNSQSETPWTVGNTYSAEVWVGGFKNTIEYTIIQNPVASLTVNDLSYPEYSEGYYNTDYNGEDFFYYTYENRYIPFSVTLKDTTVLNSKEYNGYYGVEINGKIYNIELDAPNQYEEPWMVGSYQVGASLLGVETTFNVNITETPIKSVIVNDIIVTKDLDSQKEENQDYYYYTPQFTVVLKDNRTLESEMGGVVIDGKYHDFYCDDNQYESPWIAGKTYTVEGKIGGVEAEFNVTVKKSPIKDVKILGLPLKTTYTIEEFVDLKGATIRVYYTDGTYEDVVFKSSFTPYDYSKTVYLEKLDVQESIWFNFYEIYEAGTLYVPISFLSRTVKFPIKAVDTSLTKLSIRNDENKQLYVTLNDKEYKALRFECDWKNEDGSEAGGILVLQDGNNEIKYYANVYLNDGSVYISINDPKTYKPVKSNTLDKCPWIITSINANLRFNFALVNALQNGINYDGTVTADNVDYIADFVIRAFREDFSADHIISEDRDLTVIKGTAIESFATIILGADVLDLTLSEKYDEQSGNYEWETPYYNYGSFYFDGDTLLEYVSGKWNVKERTEDGYTVTVIVDDNGIVEKWSICEHTYTDAKDTSCDNCSEERFVVTYKSGTEIKKEVDGTYWYYKNGLRCYETALVKYNNKYYYVVDGIWKSGVTDIIKLNGKYYYINKGIWSTSTTDLVKLGGKYYYVKAGVYSSSVTALVKLDGKYYYVKSGKYSSSVTDIIKISGKYYYIKKGKWSKTTLLFKDGSKYYYVKKGVYSLKVTDIIKVSGKYYYIKKGKWSKTTLLYKKSGKYYYVKKGIYSSKTNTLYKKSGKYYAIKSGKWYKSKAIIKYNGKKYYCNKGYAQTKFSGKVKISKKTYTIKKGVVK